VLERILLATDLSAEGEAAWVISRTLARQAGCRELSVACVQPAPAAYSEFDSDRVLRRVYDAECQQANDALKRYVDACFAEGLTVRTSMISGPLAEAIARIARQEHADLIVLGIRHADMIDRLLGKSLVGQVARAAPCHVLIVRPSR
jgi:nucleotide-binding universal stress UspA family protein